MQQTISERTAGGVDIVPAARVEQIGRMPGSRPARPRPWQQLYIESQLSSLRIAFFGLVVIALFSLFFSRGIPDEVLGGRNPPSASRKHMNDR